jgi:hypothetical protein
LNDGVEIDAVDEPTSAFEYGELSASRMVDELVSDRNARRAIATAFATDPCFPSRRCSVKLIVASFLSFFRFDFGFADVAPPFHGQAFCGYSICHYERLGIPRILTNRHGGLLEVPADVVCHRWSLDRLLPISGPKDGQFVVFSQNLIPQHAVKAFFDAFCHIYALLGFGKLAPLPRTEPFRFESSEVIGDKVQEFFRSQPLTEFQQRPTLSFIVAPPIYDTTFHPHSIITYVRPLSITAASEDEIRTLAFVVYSRIRVFAPSPFGMIDIARFETAMLFFGFRYQPPYLLRRSTTGITMHIGWDPRSELASWMDDIGSVLHVLPHTNLDVLARLIADLADFLKDVEMRLTLTVLGEGIPEDLFLAIQNRLGRLSNRTCIFTVSPAPALQVVFGEAFDDDALIVTEPELCYAGQHREPLITAYVVSQRHPAYICSLYAGDNKTNPRLILESYLRNMSHLSWLSVKPGSETRTISYPPHICALLRKNHADTWMVNRFEWLPSTETI